MSKPKRLKPPTLSEAQVFRWLATWHNKYNIDAQAFETRREAQAFLGRNSPFILGSKIFPIRVGKL